MQRKVGVKESAVIGGYFFRLVWKLKYSRTFLFNNSRKLNSNDFRRVHRKGRALGQLIYLVLHLLEILLLKVRHFHPK